MKAAEVPDNPRKAGIPAGGLINEDLTLQVEILRMCEGVIVTDHLEEVCQKQRSAVEVGGRLRKRQHPNKVCYLQSAYDTARRSKGMLDELRDFWKRAAKSAPKTGSKI